MSGHRTKESRRQLKEYENSVALGEEEETSVEVLAMTLGVSARWVRRNLRSTENQ